MDASVEKLLKDRYFLTNETTWSELAKRVSKIHEPMLPYIDGMEFIASSPTLMNANTNGERFGTLSSCFPMNITDSIDGIFDALKESAIVTKMGGGVGYDFTILRSSQEVVKTINRQSSGPIPFINIFNAMLDGIQQGGVRRGAGMGLLSIYHPDIIHFIRAKEDLNKIKRFNFSIKINNEFYQKLKKEPKSIWQVILKDGSKTDLLDDGKPVTVQQLWELIIENAWKVAEPGIFNEDIAFDRCTVTNISKTVLANPCSEFVNIPYASCNLGSINLSKMVDGKKFDWERYTQLIAHSTRFLDLVINQNNFPIPKISEITKSIRPIGLGVMGLAHCLYLKGIPYNSDRAIRFTDEVIRYMTLCAMRESVELAKEHGPYPSFDYELFMKANERFFKRGCRDFDVDVLAKLIKKHGIRNSCFTSIAPTGSIATIAETSTGIEPVFALTYMRKVEQLNNEYDRMYITDPIFNKYLDEHFDTSHKGKILREIAENKGSCQHIKEIPKEVREVFVVAGDMTPMEHLEVLGAAANATSLSVSKTINLPSDAKKEEIADVFIRAHELGIIGVTVYRDGSREGILVHHDVGEPRIVEVLAPKRPKSLNHELHRITVNGEKWVIFVGLMDEKPFEVFAGKVNLVDIPSNISGGIVSKIAGGTYQFEHNGEVLIKDITKIFENETHEALTRMISVALQHGTEITKIVNQLRKSKGTIVDFSKSIMRALKKYVKDGDNAGSKCPTCGETLIYIGGCIECPARCGYSACS